jgi:2-phospho-L-lactate guanylyltransferase
LKGLRVLIPFKAAGPKSRLSTLLSPKQRRKFAQLLLLDVLGACSGAGLLDKCSVISSDRRALSLAEKSGASGLAEPSDKGVNSAVEWGVKIEKEIDEFMVLPSDLPLLRPSELRHALGLRLSGFGLVLSPSQSFDGTNLLIFSRRERIRLSYDSDSFWNHLKEAAKNAPRLAVFNGRGVLFDVDTPADFALLARQRTNSPSAAFARKALG